MDVKKWSVNDVSSWLYENNFSDAVQIFRENDIDGLTMLHLTERMVERMFTTIKQQIAFITRLVALRQSALICTGSENEFRPAILHPKEPSVEENMEELQVAQCLSKRPSEPQPSTSAVSSSLDMDLLYEPVDDKEQLRHIVGDSYRVIFMSSDSFEKVPSTSAESDMGNRYKDAKANIYDRDTDDYTEDFESNVLQEYLKNRDRSEPCELINGCGANGESSTAVDWSYLALTSQEKLAMSSGDDRTDGSLTNPDLLTLPERYVLPQLANNVTKALNERSPLFFRQKFFQQRKMLVNALFESMMPYNVNPSIAQFNAVVTTLMNKYPFLKKIPCCREKLVEALRNKFVNYRSQLLSQEDRANMSDDPMPNISLPAMNIELDDIATSQPESDLHVNGPGAAHGGMRTSVAKKYKRIENPEAQLKHNLLPWPMPYVLPTFPHTVEQLLQEASTSFFSKQCHVQRLKLMTSLFQSMVPHVVYPTSYQYQEVVMTLMDKHRFLREIPGSFGQLLTALRTKFKKYRQTFQVTDAAMCQEDRGNMSYDSMPHTSGNMSFDNMPNISLPAMNFEFDDISVSQPENDLHENSPITARSGRRTRVNKKCKRIENPEALLKYKLQPWPVPYVLPKFPDSVEQLLQEASLSFFSKQCHVQRWTLMTFLFQSMLPHVIYPTSYQYQEVVMTLMEKHPFLREIPDSYGQLLTALRTKFKKYRQTFQTRDSAMCQNDFGDTSTIEQLDLDASNHRNDLDNGNTEAINTGQHANRKRGVRRRRKRWPLLQPSNPQPWPAVYSLPEFPHGAQTLLDSRSPSFFDKEYHGQRKELIHALFDSMVPHGMHPLSWQYRDVVRTLMIKHDFLQEITGSFTQLLLALRNMFKKVRSRLQINEPSYLAKKKKVPTATLR